MESPSTILAGRIVHRRLVLALWRGGALSDYEAVRILFNHGCRGRDLVLWRRL